MDVDFPRQKKGGFDDSGSFLMDLLGKFLSSVANDYLISTGCVPENNGMKQLHLQNDLTGYNNRD